MGGDTPLKHHMCGSLGKRKNRQRKEHGGGPRTGCSWAHARVGWRRRGVIAGSKAASLLSILSWPSPGTCRPPSPCRLRTQLRARWNRNPLLPLAMHTLAASSGQIHCDGKRCSIWSGLLWLPNRRGKNTFKGLGFQLTQIFMNEKLHVVFQLVKMPF